MYLESLLLWYSSARAYDQQTNISMGPGIQMNCTSKFQHLTKILHFLLLALGSSILNSVAALSRSEEGLYKIHSVTQPTSATTIHAHKIIFCPLESQPLQGS